MGSGERTGKYASFKSAVISFDDSETFLCNTTQNFRKEQMNGWK